MEYYFIIYALVGLWFAMSYLTDRDSRIAPEDYPVIAVICIIEMLLWPVILVGFVFYYLRKKNDRA